MKELSDFLARFLRLDAEREAMKKTFIESVQSVSGIALTPESVAIKNSSVAVSGTPALKNRLFMDTEKILSHFNTRSSRPLFSIR